ncbi:alkylglycerol monooxygenase isoform X2 [Hypanus sabinus]|uniref:alkylglycerol monooxygenase isoform X2 n=1 Tax=Hypanus sabinus TaxID=79690 RepID=UPI0028C4DE1F|nr:alkylglycerol monooxygenase isoform X2 [Hypanus sabinus]
MFVGPPSCLASRPGSGHVSVGTVACFLVYGNGRPSPIPVRAAVPGSLLLATLVMLQSSQFNLSLSQGFRVLFYGLTPSESSCSDLQEVQDYVQQAIPYFVGLMVIELTITWFRKGQMVFRVNDALTSISAGIISKLPELFGRGIELTAYIYIWENFRLYVLPWNSSWTWWLAFIGVDFAYYWLHRMSHEVNVMWAAHQVHHSSEDYNLSTALRQSLLQKYFSWVFNLPMALFIPPSVFAVHIQFNLLYQFWIHTEIIGNLGPLELILNTPSHHRVHHGRNPYCIDKNYAGTLIIWDRIFGTFEPENEKIIYGLTHPINAFEPLWVQFHHLIYIWKTFWATPGISNKISVVFKGPGWEPGKPRLGNHEDLPAISGKETPHNPQIPVWLQVYAVLHSFFILGLYLQIVANKSVVSETTILLGIGYIILTLTSIGLMMENRTEVNILEFIRCSAFLFLHELSSLTGPFKLMIKVGFSLCSVYWGLRSVIKF